MADESAFFHNVADPARFRAAIARFDELNSADPNRENIDGQDRPREVVNAERLCRWIMRLEPNASEELRLAARSQHLCRWLIPRDSYPMTRAGYHQWKNDLKKFHADKSAEVLRAVGYPEPVVSRVSELNLKKRFPADPETRVLEDALCLVFLEFQLSEFAEKTDEDKVTNALRKSWEKMTPQARDEALKLPYEPRTRSVVERALETPG